MGNDVADRFEEYILQLEQVAMMVARRFSQEIGTCLEEGMTPAQFLLMRLIGHWQVTTVSDLAEKLGVTPSAVTSLGDKLTAAGLLVRERDELDRRLVRLKLTEQGEAKLAELEGRRLALLRQHLTHISETDLVTLLGILKKLATGLEEPTEENHR